jgi:hypothetical protein
MNGKSKKLLHSVIFKFGARAIGAGAPSCYGSGSTNMMRLQPCNTAICHLI